MRLAETSFIIFYLIIPC